MSADKNVDAAVGETHQRRFAHPSLVAPGQDREMDRQAAEHALQRRIMLARQNLGRREQRRLRPRLHRREHRAQGDERLARPDVALRSEEHTSELQSLMRTSYAVICLKKKKLKQ